MKTVSPKTRVEERCRQPEAPRELGEGPMKARVEADQLRQVTEARANGLDGAELGRKMLRRERHHARERREQAFVDALWLQMIGAAVNEAMTYCGRRCHAVA